MVDKKKTDDDGDGGGDKDGNDGKEGDRLKKDVSVNLMMQL